jgi:S-formylglutathione hydrolase
MYDLIVKELPAVLKEADLGLDTSRMSIMGHSMGGESENEARCWCSGHGALSLYLKNLDQYKSASAFAPACNPSRTPWGKKAFGNYINPTTRSMPPAEWASYDSSMLLSRSDAPKGSLHILVDTGSGDQFLKDGQLWVQHASGADSSEPQALEEAAKQNGRGKDEVEIRLQDGFDHSYYFISTFTPEHVAFHAKYLKA